MAKARENSELLKIPAVLDRYGITRRKLKLWMAESATTGFPEPLPMRGAYQWRVTELEEWERFCATIVAC